MGAVLVYILVAGFVVAPATVLYGLGLAVAGAVSGNWRAAFSAPHLRLLGIGGALVVVAVVLFFAFGKQLVVK